MDDSISRVTTCPPSPDTNGIFPDDYRYADSDKNSSTQSSDIYWKPSKIESGGKADPHAWRRDAFKDGYVIAGYEYFTREAALRPIRLTAITRACVPIPRAQS